MRRDRISRSRIRAQRCRARSSRTGNPCKRWAIRGGTVCLTHGGSAPQVKHAAEQRLADLIDKDRALRELARLAYSDISQFYDDQQRLRPMSDWTPTMKAVVASLKTTVYNRVVGDGKQEKALELRMWDKVRNLENLLTRISDLAVIPYRQDQSPRPGFRGSDARNRATEGETQWVNYSTRRFSSRSMAF